MLSPEKSSLIPLRTSDPPMLNAIAPSYGVIRVLRYGNQLNPELLRNRGDLFRCIALFFALV